jgi:hypothetical protein
VAFFISVHTFASKLRDRDRPERYVTRQAYENYLASNPNNESRTVFPIEPGDWQDPDSDEMVSKHATHVRLRGRELAVPPSSEYERHGIALAEAPRVQMFELCRYLAAVARDDVLATPTERRVSVLPEMKQLLQLEEWNHPNVVDDNERPSGSATFQQLARVLQTGDASLNRPTFAPNTHWRNWPDGGTL